MKKIIVTQYKAEDGKCFDSRKECLRHTKISKNAAKIAAILPNISVDKNNGEFYQHDLKKVRRFKTELCKALIKWNVWNVKFYQEIYNCDVTKFDYTASDSTLGRCAYENKYFGNLWLRLWCINSLGQEFGQPNYSKPHFI